MKTTTLVIASLIVFSCNTKQESNQTVHNTTLNVIVDITDKKLIWPNAQTIISLFQCARYPEAAYTFNMQIVSDKKTNPSYSDMLPDVHTSRSENRYDDALFRQKQVLEFQEAVRQSFISLYKEVDTSKSLQYSEVWTSVVNAIDRLAQDTNQKKILLIYSDLMEKNDAINAYRLIQKESVTSIANMLKQQLATSKMLTGIKVIIVYAPKSRSEDIDFNKMFQVYQTILEPKGVQVFQQASPTFYL